MPARAAERDRIATGPEHGTESAGAPGPGPAELARLLDRDRPLDTEQGPRDPRVGRGIARTRHRPHRADEARAERIAAAPSVSFDVRRTPKFGGRVRRYPARRGEY